MYDIQIHFKDGHDLKFSRAKKLVYVNSTGTTEMDLDAQLEKINVSHMQNMTFYAENAVLSVTNRGNEILYLGFLKVD